MVEGFGGVRKSTMEGGKDEEKIMSPLFPRLHINDTEKGPKAPPRNKMALYEQLSVPSQRFSSFPPNSMANSTSSSQDGGQTRTIFSPFRSSPASPHLHKRLYSHSSSGVNVNTVGPNLESRTMIPTTSQNLNAKRSLFQLNIFSDSKNSSFKKLRDEDDFTIPIFAEPNADKEEVSTSSLRSSSLKQTTKTDLKSRQCLGSRTEKNPNRSQTNQHQVEKPASSFSNSDKISEPVNQANVSVNQEKRSSLVDEKKSMQSLGNQSEKNPNGSQTNQDQAEKSASNFSNRDKIYEPVKQASVSVNQEKRSSLVDDLKSRQHWGNQREKNPNGSQTNQDQAQKLAFNFSNKDKISEVCVNPEKRSNLVNDLKRSNDFNKRSHQESRALQENEVIRDNYRSPHRFENDSECCGDQEHGSLQVANLERNGDVPNTALVDSISGFNVSPNDVVGVIGQKHFWKARRAIVHQQRVFAVQIFELHRLIKVQRLIAGSPNVLLEVEDNIYLGKSSVKVSHLKELSSEFVLEAPPIIVKPKDDFHRPNQSTESAPPRSSQPPYFFHPPPGNQWLIPVMSPSEGLIYKPHTGPFPPNSGFMAPLYGNCPHMSPNPLIGDFSNTGYGFSSSHIQGFGFPPLGPTFFPPYPMPFVYPSVSNSSVEQMIPFARFGSNGSENQISGNVPSQKSGVISFCVEKFQGSKESEVQGSTASSPPEKVEENVLSLFPTATLSQASDGTSGTHSNEQRTHVIKVVPHNSVSASESVARIFRSIQEERKQCD